MRQTLRKVDGSLAITLPTAFTEQNGLVEGATVELQIDGKKMTVVVPTRPSYMLSKLMAEMPQGLPRLEGWDDMPSIGLESS